MKKYLSLSLILGSITMFIILGSCKEKSVNNTIDKALKTIEKRDYKGMRKLIGTQIPSDTDMEFIVSKMVKASYFLCKYHSCKTQGFQILTDNKQDELGRITYIIPIFTGYDSSTGISNVRIRLNVGPFSLFSYDELTGFDIERDVDAKRRGWIFDNNIPTYDFDSATYSEHDKVMGTKFSKSYNKFKKVY